MRHTSAATLHEPDHLYGLDSLRALAVTGVTLFHVFPYTFRGGYLGVLLFFVISGYLLAVTTERKNLEGSWNIPVFYKKRFQRIYPPLIIVLFATTGIYRIAESHLVDGIRPELFSIIFGYNNWWQIAQNADYFTRISSASPFTPMWYLSIEIQFYLLWPLLYAGYGWICRRKSRKAGLWLICFLMFLSAVLTPVLYRSGNDVTRLYYGTDTRSCSILAGVLLGLLHTGSFPQLDKRSVRKAGFPLLTGSLILIFFAYVRMDGRHAFFYRGGMFLMTLLFCLLLTLFTDSRFAMEEHSRIFPLTWIGQHSYELYLCQYPVLFLFQYKRFDFPGYQILELVLILISAAWLRLITESAGRKRRSGRILYQNSFQKTGMIIGALLTITVAVIGLISVIMAPSMKFAGKNELEENLERNQKMLQASQTLHLLIPDSDIAAFPFFSTKISSGTVRNVSGKNNRKDYLYADPDIQNSAEVSTRGVLMIGDSVMLDAAPAIKKQLPDSYIDAEQSRQVESCIEEAQELIDEGYLNQTVVISLGTNGEIEEWVARRILDIFGPDISIFWVNLFGRTVLWEKESNQLLLNLEKEYTNLSVIDWESLIGNHPEWLWEDGEHPNVEGSEVYAILIRESLEAAEANQ